MKIRVANSADRLEIWRILEPVIREGATYALPRDFSRDDALNYWMTGDREAFVAVDQQEVLGTYYFRPNQLGGGSHVCNCGFMTAKAARGKGVARQMCLHALALARRRNFKAMQFNFVVSTNSRAIGLWESLGFEIAGRLPGAFAHPDLGFVDTLVMYQEI